MNIPPELVEQMARGNGILFAGDELSAGASVPSWSDVARELAAELDGCPPGADPRDVAQYYELEHDRPSLVRRLRERLRAPGARPTVAHTALVRLPVAAIFTTSFGCLLEQALDAAGRGYRRVVANNDVPYWSSKELQLVKLHGDLDDASSLLITAGDHERFPLTRKSLADVLKVTLQTRTVLFVGYSAADPYLRQILAEVSEESGAMARPFYTVQFGAPGLVVRDLERRGWRVIDLGPHAASAGQCAALAAWLAALDEQVRAAAPPAATPALPRPRLKASLPTMAGPFVGRDREIDELMSCLRRYESPLIIDGAAGMGKSSLATAVAHACEEEGLFDAYVWWSAGYEARPPAALMHEIGRTLGHLAGRGQRTYNNPEGTYELLIHYRCLLVVTKVTQIQHAEILEFLKGVPPTTCVLITTTSPLPVGRHVEAAPLDEHASLELIRAVAEYLDCPELLAAPTDRLLSLCRASGGSPVALNLAVGLAKQGVDLEQIIGRMEAGEGRFSLLCADAYSLLPERDRDALNLVCISHESISAAALDQVLRSLWPEAKEDPLQRLEAAWLVKAQDGGLAGERRIVPANRLVRDYYNAAIKSTRPETDRRLRDALAAYYYGQSQVHGFENWAGYDWIEANLPELLATLQWYDQTNQGASLVAMTRALYYCLGTRGYWHARLKWGDRAGQAARQMGDRQSEAEMLVRVIGWTESYLGDYARAAEDIWRGLAIFEEIGDCGGQASAFRYLGTIKRRQGDLEGAAGLYRQALECAGLAPAPQSERLLAGILMSTASMHLQAGRLDECERQLQQALGLYRELGHEPKEAEVLSRLAHVRLKQGRLEEARELYEASEEHARAVNAVTTRGYNLLGLARIAHAQGDTALARHYAGRAQRFFGALCLTDVGDEIAALLALTQPPAQGSADSQSAKLLQ